MSEEFKQIVDKSFEKSFEPIWLYTEDYLYGMMPADEEGKRWTEVVYTMKGEDLRKKERNAMLSYQFLFEELEKGISFYRDDFNVNNLKAFADSIEDKPFEERIKAIIEELKTNSKKYSEDLPIIRSKDETDILKEKV
jgi:hypothetical protein